MSNVEESTLRGDCSIDKEISGACPSDEQPSGTASVWKNKYLLLLADLENTKKRLERVSALEIKGQKIQLLQDVLQIADRLDLILNHISGVDDSRNIFQGMEGLQDILYKFFIKYDVKMIDALGAVFNPSLHEAIGMIQQVSADPNTVMKIEKKGYLYQDKLLRPAQVLVASN